jgi:CelD/BcsL family acetyltransferase involved in cellulose biosynthesis
LLSPAGTYVGWLAAECLQGPRAEALLRWVLRSRAPLWWRVNPFDPCAAVLEPAADEPDATHVLYLAHGPDTACEHASRGHRTALRKARRSGLRVRRAVSADDWAGYYAIYESSLARWGEQATSRYGAGLFELLRRRGSPDVELWLVELDEATVVAGGLCVYGPNHAAYWHGAALAEYFDLRPANLLVHEFMVDACARGLDWFDLNPSGGHEGVDTFKQRVGAESLPCPIIRRERAWDLVLDRLLKPRERGPVAGL